MDKYILILVTVSSLKEGEDIAKALIEERLAACANLIPGVNSFFSWKGDMCKEEEVVMLIKSREGLFQEIMDRVKELHSYDVPEIIAIPITIGSPDYFKWMEEVLKR